ncbi:sec1 family domain-containing protein 1 [Nematocida major]|uniref:sec1 family domain-containing protein 1 n=1 Tax=Nematocida major TaxID=1912982 RepID=UPI00200815B8|nr:sec1 family domain-containing protein 1 [Nematocida major]KAH9386565.1 sec1 family domain-containing protein 1 [Nematocida major]
MLRERQAQELSALLKGETFEWSILILDKEGQDVISPLFVMTDLMEVGVVQCLKMEDVRERNPETRAIYFVKASEENVDRIVEDAKMDLYSRVEVLFTGIVSTSLLRDMSIRLASIKEANRVVKVFDAISTHSCLHENMYTLGIEKSYAQTVRMTESLGVSPVALAQAEMAEHADAPGDDTGEASPEGESENAGEQEEYVEKAKMALLSIFKGMPAPAVYHNHKLSQRIAAGFLERLAEIADLQGGRASSRLRKAKRPLLIILDRSEDLVGPMYHTNSYGAMINEIFDFKLNKLVIHDAVKKAGESTGEAAYNLNRYDEFYNENINEPFTSVVDKVNEDLLAYKEMSSSTAINMNSGNEEMMKSLVKLPDLVGKNKLLYNHMNIVLNAIEAIKSKHLDELFSIEEGKSLDLAEVEEAVGKIDETELTRLCVIVQNRFSRQYPDVYKMAEGRVKNSPVLKYVEENTVKHGMRSKIINNLKKMIGVGKDGVLRRIEEVYTKRAEEYSSVNVFILGGGTYEEYRAVVEYGKAQGVEVSYGSTEIFSAPEFISQIKSIAE